jgi:aspartate 4-decarboxylase
MTSRKRKKKKYHKKTRKIRLISPTLFKKYNALSPFELKNNLIKMAEGKNPDQMLNAGRGNPNFFNSFARQVFAHLQILCVDLSKSFLHDLVVYPNKNNYDYEKELKKGCQKWPAKYRDFFLDYLLFLKQQAQINKKNKNSIYHDVVLSTLGCFYPSPPQIQPHLNLITEKFMHNLVLNRKEAAGANMKGLKMPSGDFEYFATEGCAMGILYVFNTLKANFLLKKGDHIAVITPIFSPYLEMPILKDPEGYGLKIIELKSDPDRDYALPDSEIEKLKNKKIKALFMVNPANPGAYSLTRSNIEKIGNLINTERQDLIVLSDNVYAPFAPKYYSFMMSCPRNTIEVYSLSKYFGTTGWRLGICMVAKDNNFTKMIQHLPKKETTALHERYKIVSIDPNKLTFMQRLVADSRQVAEAHVGGLSTPQQAIIGLFLFYDLHDRSHRYGLEIKAELKRRMHSLYSELKTEPDYTPLATDYYSLVYIPEVTENLYGEKARNYLMKKYEYLEFLFHLSKKYHIVLLPGAGFGADPWRIRVSLANLNNESYKKISQGLRKCIYDFVRPLVGLPTGRYRANAAP